MKKTILILLVFLVNTFLAQDNLYLKIKEQIIKEYPKVNLENKLLALNIWSANKPQSKKANSELNTAASTFGYAKLKGGVKGIIAVTICIDTEKSAATIMLSKENLTKILIIEKDNLDVAGLSNIVFDANGMQIYKDVPAEEIFSSIQKLITR